jgi:VanZ family protein
LSQFARILFWLALAATLYLTLRTVTWTAPGSDKTQHAITFGVLMLLASAAYPRARSSALAVSLSALGAAIELVQPFFGRSDDVRDWLADTLGIGVALLIVLAVRALRPQPRGA